MVNKILSLIIIVSSLSYDSLRAPKLKDVEWREICANFDWPITLQSQGAVDEWRDVVQAFVDGPVSCRQFLELSHEFKEPALEDSIFWPGASVQLRKLVDVCVEKSKYSSRFAVLLKALIKVEHIYFICIEDESIVAKAVKSLLGRAFSLVRRAECFLALSKMSQEKNLQLDDLKLIKDDLPRYCKADFEIAEACMPSMMGQRNIDYACELFLEGCFNACSSINVELVGRRVTVFLREAIMSCLDAIELLKCIRPSWLGQSSYNTRLIKQLFCTALARQTEFNDLGEIAHSVLKDRDLCILFRQS